MSIPTPATWSIVTFTADEAALAELAGLQPRFVGLRFVAVVPSPMVAPSGVTVLVDQDGRLASSLGVDGTVTYVLDGRGTIAHSWPGVPEHEAITVYSARPPLPSGAPMWLFPVLAAAVLIVGIVAWASTRQPTTVDLASIPPAPAVTAAPAPVAEPAAGEEVAAAEAPAEGAEAGAEAEPEADAPDAAGPAAPGGPGKRVRVAKNVIGGWQITPRDEAASLGSVSGDVFTLKASATKPTLACRDAVDLKGTLTFSADLKVDGVTGKPARLSIRELGADKRPIKDAAAHAILGRAKGTAGWKSYSVDVKPAAGAVSARVCLDLEAGKGSASVRNLKP